MLIVKLIKHTQQVKKTNQRNNIRLLFSLIPILFFSICCKKQSHNKEGTEKDLYYEILSENKKIIGYSHRKYFFIRDTITEKNISFDLKGNITNQYSKKFLKKKSNLYFLSAENIDFKKDIYLSLLSKDSCHRIEQRFKRFEVCFLSYINYKNYKNVYKIHYEEISDDGLVETIILNKDFTILAKFYESNNYGKEIIIDYKLVNKTVKKSIDCLAPLTREQCH